MKKSSKIGLSNAHIAIFDPATNKYSVPIPLATIKSMSVGLNMAENNEYNDDGLFEVLDAFDNFEIDLTFTDLTPDEQMLLLGWDSIGAIKLSGATDDPPWIALMGERLKKDGTKRYFKYFKGKSRLESENAETRGSSVSAQPDVIKIRFGALPGNYPVEAYRSKARAILDESDPLYDKEGETWYTEVIEGQTIDTVPGSGD